MFSTSSRPHRPGRLAIASRLALGLALGLAAGACSSRLGSFTGSLRDSGQTTSPVPGTPPTLGALAELGRAYDARPGEKRASLDYAAALRANGQHAQAAAVLQRASIQNVGDREIAAAYGKSLADIGRFDEAITVLTQTNSEERPDWRILSTLGSIHDQTGDHARAREIYAKALKIAPNEPTILNNLGLSYILSKELPKAEETLRLAMAQPGADHRIEANLALVLSLQRKPIEVPARPVAQPAPPPATANTLFAGSSLFARSRTASPPKAQ